MSSTKTRKRSNKEKVNEVSEKKPKKQSSAELTAFFKNYKQGVNDFHWPLFRAVNEICSPKRVLYPGCHRHITASLVFADVLYLDNYSKVKSLYTDPKVLEWVSDNKDYDDQTKLKFVCKNFESNFGEKECSFDLVMSLSAGIVTTSCSKYVKKNGYCFVSDAHYDARMLNLDPNFQLTHVWNGTSKEFESTADSLVGHFMTTKGEPVNKAMVQESIDKPKAKRSFKLKKECLFYLFKKIK